MTRTSAPGAEQRRAGFTLVELLVVVALIGMAAAVAVLTAPSPTPALHVEAERFAARMVRAREEAILTGRPMAVELTDEGYEFARYARGRWTPLSDGLFEEALWLEGTRAENDDPRIVFDPTGLGGPAVIRLSRRDHSVVVRIDDAGEVRLDD